MDEPQPKKRRRRDQRSLEPKPMALTERDRDIIEAVHVYRVLRQDQLQALFFPLKNPNTARAAAQRVLLRLFEHGFLARKFFPVMFGGSPAFYVLDRKGAELLRRERGYEDIAWYNTSKDLKTEFLEHTTAINDFRIAVTVACKQQGIELITWFSEAQMKAAYDRVSIQTAKGKTQWVSVIPDSYFVLSTELGKAHFFLELDRGTETLSRWKSKIRAYNAYYASGGYEHRFGAKSLRILTVAIGETRLKSLRFATEQITEQTGGQRRFWFGLAANLVAKTVLTKEVWQIAGENQPRALIEPKRGVTC